ncbi:MAG: cell division protein FtsA [Alphaproteobacteria bacterium]|nr:cell division protein FtsA [Alphaproteobacteria bacterium]
MTKRLNRPRTGTIVALDIGTSKVCCLIARVDRPAMENAGNGVAQPRIVGTGLQVSAGLKNGVIVDVDVAETAIRKAVFAAEQMAGDNIRSVTVNLNGGKPRSQTLGVDVDIGGLQIDDADLQRVFRQSLAVEANGHANGSANGHANGLANGHRERNGHRTERELIHSIPVAYTVDGNRGIRDPRGMFGDRLSVNMHLVTAASGVIRTLRNVVDQCHLHIDDFVIAPYASGLSTLVEDETDLGVTVIDMGAGTTSIAVFSDGDAVYTDIIPVGGAHVTNDIARGLSTPISHAERLKTLHGAAMATSADEHELIDVLHVGEDEHNSPNHIPRSLLNGIIQPRLEETFELVRERLTDSGFDPIAGRRVVLTGGGSQLQGVRELAAIVLDKQVRMGRPLRLRGLPESMSGPAFATTAGMIAFALDNPSAVTAPSPIIKGESGGLGSRLGNWIHEHF